MMVQDSLLGPTYETTRCRRLWLMCSAAAGGRSGYVAGAFIQQQQQQQTKVSDTARSRYLTAEWCADRCVTMEGWTREVQRSMNIDAKNDLYPRITHNNAQASRDAGRERHGIYIYPLLLCFVYCTE